MDVLTPGQRKLNMSRIRGKDTRPEMILRRRLHAAGLRYRLHVKNLPGKPDLVFPRFRAVILVHGCFWHGHGCPSFKLPRTRTDFWRQKIEANRARDERTNRQLRDQGWRLLTVWGCSLTGPARLDLQGVLDTCRAFILGDETEVVIRGRRDVGSASQ